MTSSLLGDDRRPREWSQPSRVELGLRANRAQFLLLLAVNAFVGAMVGVERSALPIAGQERFALSVDAVAVFVAAFGAAKALTNLGAGRLAGRIGRRRTLVAGWVVALPVPFLVWFAPSWAWVVGANVLLGASQGLAWTMTVLMKLELVGPTRRGLASALNEFTGYLAVGVAAYVAAALAESVDSRAGPAVLAAGIAAAGLALSLAVHDTAAHARAESAIVGDTPARPWFARLAIYQAGFANNANDAVAWALVPLFLASRGADLVTVGTVAAAYPAVWSVAQLVTGTASDRLGRRPLVVAGMLLQAFAIVALARLELAWAVGAAALWGLGTAFVYPTLIAATADVAPPAERPVALGVYRFWRDAGLVAGALGAGALAASASLEVALMTTALVTAVAGITALALRT